MKLVQKETKLWTNNGQFVLRPSSLTRLSKRFHKNASRSFKKHSYFLSSSLNVTMSCSSNSVTAAQFRIKEEAKVLKETAKKPGNLDTSAPSNEETRSFRTIVPFLTAVSQVSVRITGCITKGCRLSYQCFILVSLSLCFLLIKPRIAKGLSACQL